MEAANWSDDAAVARLGVHGRLDPGPQSFGPKSDPGQRCGSDEISSWSGGDAQKRKKFLGKKVGKEKLAPNWRQETRTKDGAGSGERAVGAGGAYDEAAAGGRDEVK